MFCEWNEEVEKGRIHVNSFKKFNWFHSKRKRINLNADDEILYVVCLILEFNHLITMPVLSIIVQGRDSGSMGWLNWLINSIIEIRSR